MSVALRQAGLGAEREVPIPVFFRGARIAVHRADIIVESKVLLELKAGRTIDARVEVQVLNYLRATNIEVGLILNFGERATFKRMLFTNDRKVRS